jgi:hypothetical protein
MSTGISPQFHNKEKDPKIEYEKIEDKHNARQPGSKDFLKKRYGQGFPSVPLYYESSV